MKPNRPEKRGSEILLQMHALKDHSWTLTAMDWKTV